MKVLLVLCAVVLACQAMVAPERVHVVEDEGVVARAGPAEEPAPELEGLNPVQLDIDLENLAANGLALPMISKACTNSDCSYVCRLIGFSGGYCVSSTTCQCF